MISINLTLIFGLILLIILGMILLTLGFLITRKKDRDDTFQQLTKLQVQIQNDIKMFVAPNFINLSPSTDDLVKFAIEIWRLDQRIEKTTNSISENQRKSIENPVEKMKKYLEKYDISIVDYTGKKFNDGLNLDVLSGKIDNESIIQQTVEPTIMHRGQVVKKAKIILSNK